ncbi:PrsW family intramembrane metalloprotease [Demequina lignilytica]|uniref:PrsW family glutamic-type intramembrane protease n=1 Tax=Demequina lignilytica TaxID=3051663 RepID=A0AB35MHV7_9MICO|nr:PrsW family glutamic-type intramembrane protease [Demequina sp. SYSU T0a273]MDN4483273.1 PrsW family glutamic-type intramembrane protease [Demequina sp. SYSU T0a273]
MSIVRHPVTWVYAVLLVIGVIGLVPLLIAAFEGSPAGFLLGVVLWTLFTVLAWWAIRRFSRTRPRPRLATLAAFAWGAIIATGLGRWATGGVGDIAGAVIPDEGWAGAIAAGVSEEPLKLLGVFALSLFAATRMRSALDFVYYGAFVGLGFMVVESLLYAAQGAQTGDSPMTIVVEYVILRGILAALWSHPTFTALAAIGLAVLVRSGASAVRRWLAFLGMLVLAMALHALFDSPVLESNMMVAFFAKGAIVLAVFLAFYLPLRRRAAREAAPLSEETPEPASASS